MYYYSQINFVQLNIILELFGFCYLLILFEFF
jgi:hypothetical protein